VGGDTTNPSYYHIALLADSETRSKQYNGQRKREHKFLLVRQASVVLCQQLSIKAMCSPSLALPCGNG
jgi:hypothetical protein